MKFIKSKEFIFGVGGFTLLGIIVWIASSIKLGLLEFWWLPIITIPLSLIISVPISYGFFKANHIYDKPIDYTFWKEHSHSTITGPVFGPNETRYYTTFTIVYKDGTTFDNRVVSGSDEYNKLMKYYRPNHSNQNEQK